MVPIILLTQFYIPNNKARLNEIQFCLKFNLNNPLITKIVLIQESEYTYAEMGFHTDIKWKQLADQKLQQIDIQERLTYSKAFQIMHQLQKTQQIPTHYILSNSDIFFNTSLRHIHRLCNHKQKKSLCLTRHEYRKNQQNLSRCLLCKFGNISQDAWVFNSNFLPDITPKFSDLTNFQLGKPGCDNRIAFLLKEMGLAPSNPSKTLKIFHFHSSQYRTYSETDRISSPYLRVAPTYH